VLVLFDPIFLVETGKPDSLEGNISSLADVLSTGVIIIALFELYESSLQSSLTLHSYCENLTETILATIYIDLKRRGMSDDEIAVIDTFCSQFVLHIFNEILPTRNTFIIGDFLYSSDIQKENRVIATDSLSGSLLSTPVSACYEVLRMEIESPDLYESSISPSLSRMGEKDSVQLSGAPAEYPGWHNQPLLERREFLSDLECIRTSMEQTSRTEEPYGIDDLNQLPLDVSLVETEALPKDKPFPREGISSKNEDVFASEENINRRDDVGPPTKPSLPSSNIEEDLYWKAKHSARTMCAKAREVRTVQNELDRSSDAQKMVGKRYFGAHLQRLNHNEYAREVPEATTGADQEMASALASPEEGLPIYERSSPLLEEDETAAMSKITLDEDHDMVATQQGITERPPLPRSFVIEEELLTQEELDHIAAVQRAAEEASYVISKAQEITREESEATFGADQEVASDLASPE
ncbi:unnamed protein product, partial [Strongylus vulgaris]